MKLLFLTFIFSLVLSSSWLTNIDEAKKLAQKENKFILLNFSGSDWCGPCIRMHKEVFDNSAFQAYADTALVLVNADFPRMKKNQLSAAQQKINDATADMYNPKGIFPYTLLLDANGKVITTWEGFYEKGPQNFISQIQQIIKSRNQ